MSCLISFYRFVSFSRILPSSLRTSFIVNNFCIYIICTFSIVRYVVHITLFHIAVTINLSSFHIFSPKGRNKQKEKDLKIAQYSRNFYKHK